MKLRRLNANGIKQFNEFLDSLESEIPEMPPFEILNDPSTSEAFSVDIEIDIRSFANRFAMAEYLDSKLTESGLLTLERDVGLWSWLALFYFDQLCPVDEGGRRQPRERARWIPAVDDFRKYYRHLLAGPYRIYRAHRDDPARTLAVLAGPVDKPGDIAEQLASRQEIVTNKAAMQLATSLYISDAGQPKRGAAGRGPGSVRRLADILNQYDLTWDLYVMPTENMLALLPHEFDRFRPDPK